jgi:hypothetical protein
MAVGAAGEMESAFGLNELEMGRQGRIFSCSKIEQRSLHCASLQDDREFTGRKNRKRRMAMSNRQYKGKRRTERLKAGKRKRARSIVPHLHGF